MRRTIVGIIVLSVAWLVLSGARTLLFPPNARQLVGAYSLDDSHSGEKVRGDLVVYRNGTFVQHLLAPNQGRLIGQGHWRSCSRMAVCFDGFLCLEGTRFVPKTNVQLSPEWNMNQVEIRVEQGRFYYRRTGNAPGK